MSSAVEAPRKHFTVEEANRALPLVRAIVSDFVEHYRGVEDLRQRLAALAGWQHAWCLALMRADMSPLMPLAGFEALSEASKAAFMAEVTRLTDAALERLDEGKAAGALRDLDRRATRLNTGTFGWLTRGTIDPAAQEATA